MKQYLLIDCYSDTKELKNYNELKELHINEIKNDLLDNYTEREIVVCDTNTLVEYAKGKIPTMEEIKENLEGYNYKIIDLLDLQRDLEDVKGYMENKCHIDGLNEVIDLINKECNKVC